MVEQLHGGAAPPTPLRCFWVIQHCEPQRKELEHSIPAAVSTVSTRLMLSPEPHLAPADGLSAAPVCPGFCKRPARPSIRPYADQHLGGCGSTLVEQQHRSS